MKTPSEQEFLETLGLEPVEARPMDGLWAYVIGEEGSLQLRLSFNTHEQSVQTAWTKDGAPLCVVVHEDAVALAFVTTGETVEIHGTFGDHGQHSELRLLARPRLEVRWSTLVE